MARVIRLAANFVQVEVGPLSIWFSYQTPIAFRVAGSPLGSPVVRQNSWGPTTGKHLNAIDGGDKSARLPSLVFQQMLSQVEGELEVAPTALLVPHASA
jgi:hypothetical protein